jgi:hypothetical protein
MRNVRRRRVCRNVGLSQEPVHDVKADQPLVRMFEASGTVARIVKAERLPQANCVLICLHDTVELHRRIPILRRNFEDAGGVGDSMKAPPTFDQSWEPPSSSDHPAAGSHVANARFRPSI